MRSHAVDVHRFCARQIDAAVAGISDPDSRTIATAEALYFADRPRSPPRQHAPYLDATDPALRYSACFICGYASLSLNRIADAAVALRASSIRHLTMNRLPSTPCISCSPLPRASCCTCLPRIPPKSFIRLRRICPRPAPVRQLRDGARLVSARRIRPQPGHGGKCLIMKQGSYPISELFLHLAASMACMSLKDIDAAKAHFGAAWDIARPDGLIELIGEHHGLLQGLIEHA